MLIEPYNVERESHIGHPHGLDSQLRKDKEEAGACGH
jgi:hypothetical protein